MHPSATQIQIIATQVDDDGRVLSIHVGAFSPDHHPTPAGGLSKPNLTCKRRWKVSIHDMGKALRRITNPT